MKLSYNHDYVNLGPRFVAAMIDHGLWNLPLLWLLWKWSSASNLEDLIVMALSDLVLLFIPISILGSLYSPFFISKWGATIGKMLIGAEVADDEKQKLTLTKAFFRQWVSQPLNYLTSGLSYFWIMVDPKHQGIHDLLSNTFVYPKNSKVAVGLVAMLVVLAVNGAIGYYAVTSFMANTALQANISEMFQLQ